MRVAAIAFLFAVLAASACSQRHPSLGEPQPVDVRVTKVDWHPDGSALVYTREEENGIGVGTFRLGDRQGKVLVHLKPGESYEYDWLAGTPCLILNTYRDVDGGKLASVYLLNSKKGTADLVFTRQTAAPDTIDIDVDPSPSLLHAIFRVKEGKRKYHMVLPITGGQLKASQDLDDAVNAGYFGPVWSADGTAIYQNQVAGGEVRFVTANDESVQTKTSKAVFDLAVQELRLEGSALTLRLRMPAPPIGTPVYEVVPANGVLRPIRFRGEWRPAPTREARIHPKQKSVTLSLSRGGGEANSLWLVPDVEGSIPALVTPHAQLASLAPNGSAVAYAVDTALFVRSIEEK